MKSRILLLLWLVLPAAWAEPAADALATQVMANEEWTGDLGKCPVDLFAANRRQEYDRAIRNQCFAPSGQEACMASCKAGQGQHCYWLANALQSAPQNKQAAEVLFQRACKLGIASGCTNRAAGMMAAPPTIVPVDSCEARTFEQTCAADDAWGCSMYGFILSRDKSAANHRERAIQALKKACKYGADDPACASSSSLIKELSR
ncbi:hypothetical protein [Pseudoduganella sp. OTU4001]|uniref:hypothetical protein n=1 Tax=Pseudoduganella sp. OTU4001 TaxID=3043854 RepID=UPI00313A9C39